jgi:hypothetical protein
VEDAHPYHIVVVAGQEVPTHSGVPRGLAGVTKGLGGRGGHRKDEAGRKEGDSKSKDDDSNHCQSVDDELEFPLDQEGMERSPSPITPAPHTPPVYKHPQGAKGWSTMLDGESTSFNELSDLPSRLINPSRLVLRPLLPS